MVLLVESAITVRLVKLVLLVELTILVLLVQLVELVQLVTTKAKKLPATMTADKKVGKILTTHLHLLALKF